MSAVPTQRSAFVSPEFHEVLVMADHDFSSDRQLSPAIPGRPQPDFRSVVQLRLQLRACGPGRLNPWMGPSLRGLLAKPLKERWCHWEPQVRDRDYRHCAGCPHQRRCDYAQLLEPGPVDPVVVGRWNAPHGLAIIPDFPVPPEAMPDGRPVAMGVMLQFLDPSAGIIDEVVHHLDRCGRQFGLGGDRVRFRVSRDDQPPQRWDWLSSLLGSGRELPVESVRTCSLRITTATPITLKRDGEVVQQPDLVDWVAGSLRLVRSLLSRETSETIGLGAERVDQYKRLAAPATIGSADWKALNYERASNRSGDRYRVPAITGRGEYHDVPMPLARLIAVAGNLGIGQNRVCGNGQVRCDVIG